MHDYNFFSDRGIFLMVLDYVDDWWLLYLCHILTYGFLEYREISPSVCLLAFYQLQRFCFFFFFVPRDHVTDHTTQLALPQACCILALLSIFLYIWFLLLGLPFTFCWPGKYVLVFCVLVWASVLGKPTTSSSMPLLCVPTAGTHFTQITTHICFLVCLHYWTESPPTHGYSKQLWSSAWNLVCFQKIHSFKRWMNEQNLLDFTSIWHLNKHVCMSMYKGTCVKRGPWKSGMDGRVLFFFFFYVTLCIYESEEACEKASIDL